MSANSQEVLKDSTGSMPIPQEYGALEDVYQPLVGINGASASVDGRLYQVGANATATVIPILSYSGLSVVLSSASQTRLIGATVDVVLNKQWIESTVTAVDSSGTLTLDSPLPIIPALGTFFMLRPNTQTQLTGSNPTFTVVTNDTIAAGTTKYYTVDLIANLGASSTWGVAIGTTATVNSAVTLTVNSQPENIGISSGNDPGNGQSETLFTNAAIFISYPLQSQVSFAAPKIAITVKSTGTADLTGVEIQVWALRGAI